MEDWKKEAIERHIQDIRELLGTMSKEEQERREALERGTLALLAQDCIREFSEAKKQYRMEQQQKRKKEQ